MQRDTLYPRCAEVVVKESLADSPVTLIHGPRQCGKTTLARMVGGPRGYTYLSFDDDVARSAAQSDPAGFAFELPERVILDEVQRVPTLFNGLKIAVDRNREPGRFILTGSTNVLLVPNLADSLAGRMQIVRLHPFSQGEIARGHTNSFLDSLFAGRFKTRQSERLSGNLAERIAIGGYPAALRRPAGRRRSAWYRDYVDLLVQRDVRDLAKVRSLEALPRLLELAATQTSRLFNLSKLASPFQLSRNTIRDYFTLLERLFLVERLPPWHSNRMSRLVKSPKIHMGDSGLACALLGVQPAGLMANRPLLGQMLESFVMQEVRRQASWLDQPHSFFHFRDRDKAEVDLVIERGALAVAGIEVKATATVTRSDFRGLRKLKAAAGTRFAAGVVLYDGETSASFGDSMYAVPIRALWESP